MASEILSAAQMRAIEEAAIRTGDVTGLELMERAARGVVDAIGTHWPELRAGRALVLCGPGNNGGDGYVIARLLKASGWNVQLYAMRRADELRGDARVNAEIWGSGRCMPLAQLTQAECAQADVVVDALFGTGLTRALDIAGLGAAMRTAQRVVAVDIPSGLCSDSGKVLGACALRADLTVSFHRRKLGHVLAQGQALCGTVICADIGLEQPDATCFAQSIALDPKIGEKRLDGHKFTHGAALVLSGGAGASGAARLAARAALRIGAGLVTLGVPAGAEAEVAAQITALMMTPVHSAEDLTRALRDTRLRALCLGPGLGHARARALVPAALGAGLCTVLDADALCAFEAQPAQLFDRLGAQCVLTPHMGEFARLFPDISARLTQTAHAGPAYSKVDAVRAAALRAGCTVLLKGPDTVIADAQGHARIHSAFGLRAAPWLATAGAGDVLAGFITGLMARGFAPLDAASAAVHLHVDCALAFGPGLIAEDLTEVLPQVLAARQAGV